MKDQLQLHEIAGYLPYGLQIKILNHKSDYVGIEYAKVNGYYFLADQLHVTYEGGSTGKDVSIFQPCVRPMSDLTKEITHNAETFVPIERLNELQTLDYDDEIGFSDEVSNGFDVEWLSLCIAKKLYEWHFDLNNLISRNLAVDINSIK